MARTPDEITRALDELEATRRMLTINEAADLLGINHRAIRSGIHRGTLRAHLPPGANPKHPGRFRYTIAPTDLRDWWFTGYTRPQP